MSGYLWGLIRLIGRGNLRQAGRDVRAAMVAFHWNLVVWVLDSVFEMVLVVMGRQILPGGSEAGRTVVSAALVWVVRWVFDFLEFSERQRGTVGRLAWARRPRAILLWMVLLAFYSAGRM